MDRFDAVLSATVYRVTGPDLPPAHVLRHLVDDGQVYQAGRDDTSFYIEVCTRHADPDDCDADCVNDTATFKVHIHAAGLFT